MHARLKTILLLTLLLTGCTSLARLEPPQLSLTGVRWLGMQQQRQLLALTVHVSNPNDQALAIRSIDYRVSLAGEQFADGSTAESFTVPALGEAQFELNVSADLERALRIAAQRMTQGDLPWRVSGQVRLMHGALRVLPFTGSGNLSLR